MKDVMIIERIFPKYRKDILDLLHKKMEFLLLHSRHDNGVKQVTADYSEYIGSFQFAPKESNLFLNAFSKIWRYRPKVIVYEYSIGIASLFPSYYLARLLGIKFVVWGHGYDHTKGFDPKKSWADRLRVYLGRKADSVILYGNIARDNMAEYIDKEKMFVAYNCLNTHRLSAIRNKLEKEGRDAVKKRIGFTHKYNLIFIGRMFASKKPELLIEIYEKLQEQYGTLLGVHFIGDGPYLEKLKSIVTEKNLRKNVFFHGSIHQDEKTGEMLYASDMMVMPGYVGLSVNHALNFDCPITTFEQKEDGPFHSPEIEYLVHNKTGFVLEDHTVEALTETIGQYLSQPELQAAMKRNAREMVETVCSVDNFIEGYSGAVKYALGESIDFSREAKVLQTKDL